MRYPVCILLAYCVGSINPAYILARLRGFDIRRRGSGNAGASNALLLFGKLRGALCAVFDVCKAFAVTLAVKLLFPDDPLLFAVAASFSILGHIFPFYMKFRGGKGLACLGGVFLAFDLRVFGIMLLCELILALVLNYICVVPMTAAVALPVLFGLMTKNVPGSLLLAAVAVVILWRHSENIRRIRQGRELRLSYLWNKEKETERMKAHYPEEEWDHPEK